MIKYRVMMVLIVGQSLQRRGERVLFLQRGGVMALRLELVLVYVLVEQEAVMMKLDQ